MFCPKCGTQNPETGRFCRSCGADLGNVSKALAGNLNNPVEKYNRKGKPANWETAIVKMFTGIAFLIVAAVLGATNVAGGKYWWFWMLIPAFGSLGSGIAQYVQLKKAEKQNNLSLQDSGKNFINPANQQNHLPPIQTDFVAPHRSYQTGDLVPPSVTDGTTRHLEMNSEGETMTLPKK